MTKRKNTKVWTERKYYDSTLNSQLGGSGSAKMTSTSSLLNTRVDSIATNSTALLKAFAILITNEKISKLKISHTKVRDWIKIITLLN